MNEPICVIGDSISAGVVYDPEAGRYVRLKDCFINLLGSALGTEMRNHAVFGCTSTAALSRLHRCEKDAAACPRTIVMLGGNDSDYDWPDVAATPEQPHECSSTLEEYTRNMDSLLDALEALGTRPVLINMIPVDGEAYYRWISKRADGEALMRFLHRADSIEHGNELYNLALTNLALRRGLPLMDARSAFLLPRFFGGLFCEDGIHPSPAGHRRMFEYLLPQARQLLI